MLDHLAQARATIVLWSAPAFAQDEGAEGTVEKPPEEQVQQPEPAVRQALVAAWRNTAPKRLAEQLDDE